MKTITRSELPHKVNVNGKLRELTGADQGSGAMRMWMVDPATMCRQHLLGEHVEIHMMVGALRGGMNIDGFLAHGLLEPSAARSRHRALAAEMTRRGYNHRSPLLGAGRLTRGQRAAMVDAAKSRRDLAARCKECGGRL